MNSQLEQFARDTLKHNLALLPEASHMVFKRMYSPKDLTVDINHVVDIMPKDRLDWAMQQVERTINNSAGNDAL